jgi:uncharacterized protein (DUF1778 family)
MSQTETSNRDNEWLTARVDPDLKRFIGMRAEELGMDKSEYVLSLVRDDLQDVDYVDL